MAPMLIVAVVGFVLVLIVIAKTAVVVPQQNAYVVERLGKFAGTLGPGFHILLPFFDVIRYKHSLKERAIDVAEQICICLLYTSPSPRDGLLSRMPSSA